jgi:eight-cysteine-cluster-containing protein
MSLSSYTSVFFCLFALLVGACPGSEQTQTPAGGSTDVTSPNQLGGEAGTKSGSANPQTPSAGSGGGSVGEPTAGAAGPASAGRTGGGLSEDDAGVADDTCPPNIAIPAICQLCDDGTCGIPTCSAGKLTGKYRCPDAPTKPDQAKCTQTGKPVCGNDGKPYDAAGGDSCVPVPIACHGSCPCKAAAARDCVAGGCSNQLCTDAASGPVVSTCEWREEYACYRAASCERQSSGQCGWTQTPELLQCLQGSAGP